MKITKEMARKAILESHRDCANGENGCLFGEALNELPKTIKNDIAETLQVVLTDMVKKTNNPMTMMNIANIAEAWAESKVFRHVMYSIYDNGLHVGYKLRQIFEDEKADMDELNKIKEATVASE